MSNKVTYAEIIEALSGATGFSKQKSEAFSKALIARIKGELQENGKASITNFGSFKVKEVAERQGQNPQTGEPIIIPAHKRVSFTPYKALREEVNAAYAYLESELIEEKEKPVQASPELPKTESEPEPKPESGEKSEKKPEQEFESVFETESKEGPELNVEREAKPKPEVFAPKAKPRERTKGKNTGLIMVAILTLSIVAIGSIWFLLSSDEEELASEQSAVEQSQDPDAAAEVEEVVDEGGEAEEIVPEEEESEPEEVTEASLPSSESVAPKQSENVNAYTVKEDEWYWVIARNAYGKPYFWPLIFEHNFTTDTHPDSLEKNVELGVPVLEGTAEAPTKGDYRKLASAAKMVSEAYQKHGRTDKAEEYARFARRWERAGM
ncbi:MAG: HU family DNA-binding protein [Gracilimonas sp.]|uniref:HU family DNA-binding protein n=1 Tax=Gracilimonas sp. TaxID=1974203 RepID=UPI0019AE78FD|nr:HU family DNA-binding protein [Gracilimonas sp.]MBD3617010.1 HU family DNA-binding protein [Gracilimonas sp.]